MRNPSAVLTATHFLSQQARLGAWQRCELGYHCSTFLGARWLHGSQVATYPLLIVLSVCRVHHTLATVILGP